MPDRYAQAHIFLFWAVMLLFLLALVFESSLFAVFSRLPCFKYLKFYRPPNARRRAFCDDLYDVLEAKFLVRQHERACETKTSFIEYQGRRQHLPQFDPYRAQFKAYLAGAIERERELASKLRGLTASLAAKGLPGWQSFPDMEARCKRILENLPTADADRDARLRSPL